MLFLDNRLNWSRKGNFFSMVSYFMILSFYVALQGSELLRLHMVSEIICSLL